VKLPKKDGTYKFIVFAQQINHPGFAELSELSEKIKQTTGNLILEADAVEYHKHIAAKNKIQDKICIYG
jgi:hypothetical protein